MKSGQEKQIRRKRIHCTTFTTWVDIHFIYSLHRTTEISFLILQVEES